MALFRPGGKPSLRISGATVQLESQGNQALLLAGDSRWTWSRCEEKSVPKHNLYNEVPMHFFVGAWEKEKEKDHCKYALPYPITIPKPFTHALEHDSVYPSPTTH